jgi:WD40 repeat protein
LPDNLLVLLSVADGPEIARVSAQPSEQALAFSPDGALLLTRTERRLILRNAVSLAEVVEIPVTVSTLGVVGDFAPDSRMIATGSPDGKLRLWDVRRREELVAIDLGAGPIRMVVFTPDGTKVRFIAEKQVGELDLHAYDPYVEGNFTWNLMRLLPELDRTEAERVLERIRDTHPDAYRAGVATFNTAETAKTGGN